MAHFIHHRDVKLFSTKDEKVIRQVHQNENRDNQPSIPMDYSNHDLKIELWQTEIIDLYQLMLAIRSNPTECLQCNTQV